MYASVRDSDESEVPKCAIVDVFDGCRRCINSFELSVPLARRLPSESFPLEMLFSAPLFLKVSRSMSSELDAPSFPSIPLRTRRGTRTNAEKRLNPSILSASRF